MKKNYHLRGFLLAGSMALFSACQPVSNSQTSTPRNWFPLGNSQKTIAKAPVKNSDNFTKTNIQKVLKVETTTGVSIEQPKYNSAFNNLSEDDALVQVRKEMLIGLSKPGENIYKDLADRKERKRQGIRLPGEVSGIVEMAEYRRKITMPIGTDEMLYKNGFLEKEHEKALKSPFLMQAKAAGYKTSKNSTYALPNVIWKERGPNNIPGRGRSIVPSPTNPDKWYNATVGGGVWITDNAGLSWRTTTDYAIPNLATSTLAISASNANIIYAGTGEPFGNLDAITGSGIVKSLDSGETWSFLSNTSFGSVGRLLVNPTDAAQLFAATSTGIYRTMNGGTSWSKIYSGPGTTTNVQDLKASADFSTLYGAVNSYGVVKSTDGGTTWTRIFDVTGKSIKRIEMAISPADNNTIFLSTESGTTTGLYVSNDAGATFVVQTYGSGDSKEILGAQGWYDNIITAHPTNKNIAYVGGIYLAKITVNPATNTYAVLSIASGYDNTKLNTYVHPDQHGLVCQVNPNNAAQFRLLLNNDGGVYYTNYKTNPGETQNDWKVKAAGLNNTQFYGADKKKGEDSYVAGAQDNGSAATIAGPSSASSSYLALLGGDGFEAIWNYKDPQKLIFGSQYNNFAVSRTGVQNTLLYSAKNIDNGSAKSPFYSKLANANNNADVVFTVSSTGVWRTLDFGTTWSVTPFNATANGTWLGSASYATVKVSVANPDVVWAVSAVSGGATATYRVNVSKDNGNTFNKTTGSVPITGSFYASSLAASSVNAAQAYTLFSGAGQPKIVKTSDYGATWTDITGFSPVSSTGFPDVPIHSLLEMPFDTNVLWAGTDIGIFETTNGGTNWYLVTAFPPVSVWNMKIVDDQVVLATHGRGVWTATVPQLSTYVLPDYISAPSIKNIAQNGIHEMKGKAVFNYTTPQIKDLKVFVDNVYVSTISNTLPNTDYTFVSSALTEGVHTISVSGLYNSGANESVKSTNSVEIINFNAGAANVNLPTFTNADVYIGATGKFVIDNLASKFTYNVLNNVGHPYANSSTYQTYLRTPIVIGSGSKESLTHMAFTEGGYDFAVVEASKDLVNWTPVATFDENSYPDWVNVSTAAGVTEAKFKTSVLDFPANFTSGDEVAVRFRLTTDPADIRFGWILKSIVPSSTLGTDANTAQKDQISIAPNPAVTNTDLYLPSTLKGNVSIGIYDASGKVVKTISKTAASKISLDVSGLQPGLYLVLVKTESGNKALKLLKK